jgi:hypothetical protein
MFGKKRKYRKDILKLAAEMGATGDMLVGYDRTIGIDEFWKKEAPVHYAAILTAFGCFKDFTESGFRADVAHMRFKILENASQWGREGLLDRDTVEFITTSLEKI